MMASRALRTVISPPGTEGADGSPWHPSWRVGDADVTLAPVLRYKDVRGFSVIELMVTVGIFAVALGVAIPLLPNRPYALWAAQQQLLADLRVARSDALTKGDHFRVRITSTSQYAEYRMTLVGANWVENATPLRSRTLPAGVTLGTAAVGNVFEFSTRGLMLNPGAATTLALTDAHTGYLRNVTVWPSGQVVPG
jgi:prepilin-type N-terminal cleavage/methylation domain-containing protein